MPLEFLLPDVGEGMAEAQVLRWLVPVGVGVGVDESMVELETDEAVLEMPAPRAGVILYHGAPEGEILPVGSLLVVIGAAGEEWPPAESDSAPESTADDAAPLVGALEDADSDGGARALPAVRKLAAELGVDLSLVAGSGPGRRITRADVEAASVSDDQVERVPLSATRRAIARNLTRSWQEIPHVTTFSEADATPLLRARADLAADTRDAAPLESLRATGVGPQDRRPCDLGEGSLHRSGRSAGRHFHGQQHRGGRGPLRDSDHPVRHHCDPVGGQSRLAAGGGAGPGSDRAPVPAITVIRPARHRRGDGPPFPRRRGRRHRSLWCRCVTSARFSPT